MSTFHPRTRRGGLAAVALAAVLGVSSGLCATTNPQQGGGIPWPSRDGAKPAENVTGSLSIRVTQGTPGEPAIGVIDVAVDLYHRGMVLDTITTQTDEHGVVILEQLPIAMPVRPIVKVKFQELDYQIGGGMMDAQHAHQDIEVVCYAASEVPPPWKIQTRHLMITPEAAGLRVTEVMMVENPDHRTWIGVQAGGPKRNTTAFVLPAEAKDVQLGRGFHKWCCSTLIGDKLVNHLPLMPDTSEMMFSYLVPAKDGTVTLDITAPSTVDATMVVTPTMLETGVLQGLNDGGEQAMGDIKARVYSASAMASGGRASISFVNLAPVAAAMGSSGDTNANTNANSAATTPASNSADSSESSSGTVAKIVAGIGGGAILLVAAAILIRRSGRSSAGMPS
ncbi:MAG: hypothetical protein JNL80_13090 [Phycisphaerae bacterium]|nr:hypothetical protein [Phycisphaerae bacterium]